MKYFEASGLWYPGEESSNAVGGTLHFNADGLNLRLLGSFREGWSPGAERFSTIRGVVGENPYGTFVSLLNCSTTQLNFNLAGVTSGTIKCERAIIGNSPLPDGMSRFESLDVTFSYLKDWVGLTGITRGLFASPGLSVTYGKPEELSFPFEGKTLTLAFSAKLSGGSHRAVIDEDIRIRIEPIGERAPAKLGEDRIQMLQNLLAFATDKSNEVEEITYRRLEKVQGLHPEHHLIYDPVFRLAREKKSLHSSEMLFTFLDAREKGLDVFDAWLNFSERHPSFCAVYFGDMYAEPRYLNQKFSGLMLAFTLLCKTNGGVSEQAKLFLDDVEASAAARFGEEERAYLAPIIPTSAEVEMPRRLLRLLRENADLMGQILEDMPGFVRSVMETLSFFERRPDGARPPILGGDLLHAMWKVRMLIKIVVLKELGFSDESVNGIIERNRIFNHLKTV